ncbi:hypothetical protein ACCQ67_19015 [Klebsiella pneumoniae]
MTSKLARERLEKIKSWRETYGAGINVMLPAEEAEELACIALAAMDSEPVAEVLSNRPGNDTSTIDVALPVGAQLYLHAQQPVVPAVSDDIGEIRVGRLPTMNQDDYPGLGDWWVQLRIGEDSDEVLARVYGATPQEANNRAEALACRAAMLHGGNSPVIPDGYVMVPKEPTKEMINAGWLYYMGTKNPSSKGTYKAMLAAIQQEGK